MTSFSAAPSSCVKESRANHKPGPASDQVEVLKELLQKQGKSFLLLWLQQILLDTCHVKLSGDDIVTKDGHVLEPIPFHYNCNINSLWLNN